MVVVSIKLVSSKVHDIVWLKSSFSIILFQVFVNSEGCYFFFICARGEAFSGPADPGCPSLAPLALAPTLVGRSIP